MKTRSSGRSRGGYQFTSRDGLILNLIYELDKPDTSHITKLLFPPAQKIGRFYQTTSAQAIRRLEHLTRDGYIKPERAPIIAGLPYFPFAYSLTIRGYEEVALIRGVDVKTLDRPKKLVSARSAHYPHHKRVLDVLTDAMIAAEMTGIRLSNWKKTRTLREAYQDYQADLYLLLDCAGRPLNLFPEIDLGSETQEQWKERVRSMMAFWKSSFYRENFPDYHNLRFPVITIHDERMHNLMKWSEEAGGTSRLWFSTFSCVTPDTLFTKPIWQIPTVKEPHALTD
jgi:Replication-relaxation